MGGFDVIIEGPDEQADVVSVGTLTEAKQIAQDYVIKTSATRAEVRTSDGIFVVAFTKQEVD